MNVRGMMGMECFFFFFPPQAPPYSSVLSGKTEVSLQNGRRADSWKSSKQQSPQERSEKIRVKAATLAELRMLQTLQVFIERHRSDPPCANAAFVSR